MSETVAAAMLVGGLLGIIAGVWAIASAYALKDRDR